MNNMDMTIQPTASATAFYAEPGNTGCHWLPICDQRGMEQRRGNPNRLFR